MAVTKEQLDSNGGFSIGQTTIFDDKRNAKDFNTLHIANSHYTDSSSTRYILRGLNTAVLSLDTTAGQIVINNNTCNFITGHIICVNPTGTVYSAKMETALFCDNLGNTTVLSTMTTVIKDDIPTGQTWDIVPLGSTNRFSYSTTRAGTTATLKWAAVTEVISIAWS
tara:strand:+ start:1095 stop:1595 length:501 start_codon:yes stop_codon:yes gene_type:complete